MLSKILTNLIVVFYVFYIVFNNIYQDLCLFLLLIRNYYEINN